MLPSAALTAQAQPPILTPDKVSKTPLKIVSVELLRHKNVWFVRTTTADGAVGLAVCNDRVQYLYPILLQRVAPYFVGRDARQIESLIDGVYVHQSNYKLAGLALWCCVGWVEFSVFDLLGKVAKRPVGELLGGVIRKEIPVYLSSLRRDTTPEQEVAWLGKRLEETGARAVKLKVGGRMSNNADAAPKRTERLIPLARKTFGDKVTIYADANGSYDVKHGIEVGKLLEAHNVAIYEEPCPFDEYEDTKRVADALTIPVAGGEQDTSFARFRWIAQHRGLDILQPDLNYNGGFVRATRVARLAAAHKLSVAPHAPQAGPHPAYLLHFASCTPNLVGFQEVNGAARKPETWFSPSFEVSKGMLAVPAGPGLGVTLDPQLLKKAERV